MILHINKHQVLIDDNDYALCNYGRSLGIRPDKRVYLCRKVNGKNKTKLLHRIILNVPSDQEVDHKNGDPLDNRRENLRICSRSQNQCNRGPEFGSKRVHCHGFKGIVKHSKKNLKRAWYARIQVSGSIHVSKRFHTPHEAAKAYDQLAERYHGEFARLNFP